MPRQKYIAKDGESLPGVTSILFDGGSADPLMFWAWRLGSEGKHFKAESAHAMRIGTAAHALVENTLHGKQVTEVREVEDPPSDGEMVVAEKCHDQFLRWQSDMGFEMVKTEMALVSERHRFGGCFDALFRKGDELIICDWKTSKAIYQKSVEQNCAYTGLFEENYPKRKISRAMVVCIDKSGLTYKHQSLDRKGLEEGWDVFLKSLALYKAKKAFKRFC